jgi:hypothetical protein
MRNNNNLNWLDKICLPNGDNGDFILDDNFFMPEFPDENDSEEIKKKKYNDFMNKLDGQYDRIQQ